MARRSRIARAWGLCALAATLLSLCEPALADEDSQFHGFYLLSFDRYGRLTNPYELDIAIAELRAQPDVERVAIVAYGWANDGEASLGAYDALLRGILEQLPGKTAIIGIGWDSSQTGIRKLLNDLMPLPVVADSIALVPDRVLFPFSFWSKAAMADRIGFGGLRSSLNQLFAAAYPEGTRHPDLYLVGHSFGTRILSSLLIDRMGIQRVGAEPFASRPHVRGALLIQPALAAANLPPQPLGFPLMITQSEHDHANGFLFPIANLVVNAYSFTAAEAVIQQRLFAPVEKTAKTAARKAGDAIERGGRMLGADGTPEPDAEHSADAPQEEKPGGARPLLRPLQFPANAYRATKRTSAELLGIPVAALFAFVAAPVQYAYAQGASLATRPGDHVMDTLAQLPGIEIVVSLTGRAVGRDVPWGRRTKGFFSLGALHESVGRLATPAWPNQVPFEWYTLKGLDAPSPGAEECGLPRCDGVLLVDVSDEVGGGWYGDLRNPWIDSSVGWLDLVGTHSVYSDAQITSLLLRLMRVDAEDASETASLTAR
jgi:hypothetical protein